MFVNLTPHTLNIKNLDGTFVEVQPSGQVARVKVSYVEDKVLNNIQTFKAEYGEVEGLPEPEENKIYIVSGMVQNLVPERADVYSPGNLIRDENGKPVGCDGLKQ